MRALVGWILALGLVVSPAVAKAGGAAGEGSPATAKTDQPVTPATTAPAANSTAAPAKPAAANLESELDELRDVLQTQAKQIQEQNDALKQQQAQMEALEKQLKASASTDATAPAAPATTTMASAAFPSPAPAASSPAPAPAAAAPQGEQPSPLYFSIGGAHFTPGGFLDLTDVFRTEATGNGIGSNFGAIPYNNVFPTAGLTEDRFSLQNSRLTLRVDSKVAGGDAVGYLEADFLGNAAASLNVTSNSNTLRMRVYFLDYRKGKFEILAGQDWSMLTANRTGIGFMPGDVFNTQDFDTNYQMGLVWERTPQFRFIVHPNKTVAFGVSIEDPEQYVTSAVTLPRPPSLPPRSTSAEQQPPPTLPRTSSRSWLSIRSSARVAPTSRSSDSSALSESTAPVAVARARRILAIPPSPAPALPLTQTSKSSRISNSTKPPSGATVAAGKLETRAFPTSS